MIDLQVCREIFWHFRLPLASLVNLIITLIQASVSATRVNDFLNGSELDEEAVSHYPAYLPIEILDGTFKWGDDTRIVLKG